jgi:hypothetical protein
MQEISFTVPETGPNAPTPEPADPKTAADPAAPTQETPAAPAAITAPEGEKPADKTDEAAEKVADAAGFDLSPFSTEFEQTGDVSAENRAKIADGLKHVLGDDAAAIVNDYVEGKKAIQANDQRMFDEATGGDADWAKMTAWAANSLPAGEIAALNRQLESGDRHAILLGIEGVKNRYHAANGRPGNPLIGGGGPANVLAGYASQAQMVAAMNDPRYQKDEAYREHVRQRLALSNF